MLLNKTSYFQGTEEPKPKQRQYKADPALSITPRYKKPLYKNMDLYDCEGADGNPVHGTDSGYHSLMNYKSVSDFLAAKRKRLENKYKADDKWIQDDGSLSNKHASLFGSIELFALAIDFAIDDQINSGPILGDSGTFSDSVPIGGAMDEYLTRPDVDGKQVETLNFSHDLHDESHDPGEYFGMDKKEIHDDLDQLLNTYLNPEGETELFGLPNGLPEEENIEDLSHQEEYGTTDSGNLLYNINQEPIRQ